MSTEHIGPFIEFFDGGGYARVKIPGSGGGPGGKRGEITSFTLGSSRRLQAFMQSVNREKVKAEELVFMTLTYHLDWLGPRESKEQHLKAFKKRFERAWGPHPAIWKLEPQQRGVPHFHLMIWIGPGIDAGALTRWTAENWNDIVGGSKLHLAFHLGTLPRSRPCVERIRSWNGAAAYCAERYMGKPVDGSPWSKPGRWWGKWREDLWPRERIIWPLALAAAIVVKRCLRRFLEHQPTGRFRIDHGIWHGRHEVERSGPHSAEYIELMNSGWQQAGLPEPPVRPIHRRRFRATGGISAFISADGMRRVLIWALQNVSKKTTDILCKREVGFDDEVPSPSRSRSHSDLGRASMVATVGVMAQESGLFGG